MSDKAGRKGCSFGVALVVGLIACFAGLWVIPIYNEHLPGAVVIVVIPFGCLLLSWYKQHIGGLLTMLSGFLPIIILSNIPSLKGDMFYGVGLMFLFVSVTLPLLVAGIVIFIAPSKEERRKLAEIEERERILTESEKLKFTVSNEDRETFNYIVNLCPFCGSPNMKKTIIQEANNPEERKSIGFTQKFLFNCDNCKSTWFAVVK